MGEWKKTTCTFCALYCGLEVEVEDNHIVNVRPDPDNPRSKNYCCRKGRTIKYYQENQDRLDYPLKRVGDEFVRISWDQAMAEIAAKLGEILQESGPRAVGNVGGAGANTHSSGPFGATFMGMIGSQYNFNPVGCEFMSLFWNVGKITGRQFRFFEPDDERVELSVIWGSNSYVSHQKVNARDEIRSISEDPNRLFVVVDPRLSESARIADIHIALRPGTDALLLRAMLALILKEGWENKEYIQKYIADFDKVKPWFEGFDIEGACRVCQVPYEQVRHLCQLFSTKAWGVHMDLGLFMGRHNTMSLNLLFLLAAVTGRLCAPGGTIGLSALALLGPTTDDQDPNVWKMKATGFAPVCGVYPEVGLAPEILMDDPERIRALIVTMSNPARSFPETDVMEQALDKLDLLVVADVVFTETCQHADYVLPTCTPLESYDFGIFLVDYPKCHVNLKTPVVQPSGERIETAEFWLKLMDAMNMLPPLPETLYKAAYVSRQEYFGALMGFLQQSPELTPLAPVIVGKTLGKAWGSPQKAILWAILMLGDEEVQDEAIRAGYTPGPFMMDEVFQSVLDHPEGTLVGIADVNNNYKCIKHEDGKFHFYVDVLDEYIKRITPELEEKALVLPKEYPFILSAGNHFDGGHNGWMRNSDTYKFRNPCVMSINPEDAKFLGIEHGAKARVTTKAGSLEVEADYTYKVRPGYVIIPHQFGFKTNGKVYGVAINKLTSNSEYDELTGDPLWRYTPCRIEAV